MARAGQAYGWSTDSDAEPRFLAFNAAIEMKPVMAPDDLAKAAPDIAGAAEKYGQYDLRKRGLSRK